MFTLRVNDIKIFNNTIGIVSDFISDATFHVTNEGLKLIAMDPANISMVILTILPSAFTEYSVNEPTKITINLEGLKQALRRVRTGESLTLTHSNNRLNATISGTSTRKFTIPLIDNEEVERKVPELKFNIVMELDSREFKDFIEDAAIVGEAVTMRAAEGVFNLSSGDTGRKVDIKLRSDSEILKNLTIKESSTSIYSIDYLKKMTKASSFSETAKLGFSSDYPLRLDFKAVNLCQLSFILAPRIENK
mgnify:CR=1 FL=1